MILRRISLINNVSQTRATAKVTGDSNAFTIPQSGIVRMYIIEGTTISISQLGGNNAAQLLMQLLVGSRIFLEKRLTTSGSSVVAALDGLNPGTDDLLVKSWFTLGPLAQNDTIKFHWEYTPGPGGNWSYYGTSGTLNAWLQIL